MSNQTLGGAGMPKNWGAPRTMFNYATGKYKTGGIIWMGRSRTTGADKRALRAVFGDRVKIDGPSTRGKDDPKYSTFSTRVKDKKAYNQTVIAR